MNADYLLSVAMNPLRSDVDRKVAYDNWELEKWFDAVMSGRLHATELEPKWTQKVRALIIQRANNMR